MTFLVALALLWVGVNGLHSPDAAWTVVGGVLLCSLAFRRLQFMLLGWRTLRALEDSTEDPEPERPDPGQQWEGRGHGGRMTPWN